ncbi:MAG TPA: tripartite tricarboxylate transporter substrate-binding protein [Pseudolabrys sp.]|nr:tripartite tricarboxylate transporter substrate-binding protein [Pseudolabrys sp.]
MSAWAFFLFVSAVAPAQAQSYPDRPIKFIVGFGSGGPTDIVARVLADQLSGILKQKVIVENKPGASGNLATQAVASAEADGGTYLIGASPIAINATLYPDFPVKVGKDIVPVAPIGANDNVLVVQPSLGVKDVASFVRLATQRPGALTYAALGVGSSSHLAGVAFDMRAGTKMVPAMYRSGGEALKDLLGGQVQAWFAPIPSVRAQIRAGTLVAIATTGPSRSTWLPEVPTFVESGFAGYDVRLWVGLFAPAGVPSDRLKIIEDAVVRSMASPEMRHTLETQSITPLAMRQAEFARFVVNEIVRWKGIVETLKP